MNYGNFLNFFENMDAWLKNNENRYLTDKIIRMVFLNFAVKDKKVLNYQWNPKFETIAKLPSVLECRRQETYPELMYDTIVTWLPGITVVVDYYGDYFKRGGKISSEEYLVVTL
jgi:hypothetical protein